MVDSISFKNVKAKVTVKSLISVAMIALSTLLPLLFHTILGVQGGTKWLPMYLPVIIGGCLLGSYYGIGIGALSPIVSHYISQLVLSSAMPPYAKLPYMVVELAIFGLVAGLFSKKIASNPLASFPAVLAAQVLGRLAGYVMNIITFTGQSSPYSFAWSVVEAGLTGLYLQAVLIPIIVILLAKLIKNERN